MVKAAYSSGKPAFGVGGGNSTMVVDETADVVEAARNTRMSKTSDFGSGCSADGNLLIEDGTLRGDDRPVASSKVVTSPPPRRRLVSSRRCGTTAGPARWPPLPSRRPSCAAAAGFSIPDDRTFIIVEQDEIGREHRFSGEKLTTLLAMYGYDGFDDAFAKVRQIYEVAGKGHSCGIYWFDDEHIDALARIAPVSRIMVRQPQSKANAGSFTNGMPMTSSLGCGIWGGNVTNENIRLKHYLNVTWVSYPIAEDRPSEQELFGEFYRLRLSVTPPEFSLAYLTVFGVTPLEQVDIAAEAGYDFVGLRLTPVAPGERVSPLADDSAMMQRVTARLADTGVRVLDVELARLGPDEAPDDHLALLETAATLGARHIVGQIRDPDRQRSTDRFGRLCDLAAEFGLTVELEFPSWMEVGTLSAAATRPRRRPTRQRRHPGRRPALLPVGFAAGRPRSVAPRMVPLHAALRRPGRHRPRSTTSSTWHGRAVRFPGTASSTSAPCSPIFPSSPTRWRCRTTCCARNSERRTTPGSSSPRPASSSPTRLVAVNH